MENLIFLLSESWSTVAADQFFSMFRDSDSSIAVIFSSGVNRAASNTFFAMFRFVAATGFVAILAYYATKKMVGSNSIGRKNSNISVIESVNVGGQAAVKLLKVGEKYLVLGITRERVCLLSEIDKEQIVEPEALDLTKINTPFGKVLSRFVKQQDSDRQGNDDNE